MGTVNTGLPLEALQLIRAFNGEITTSSGTVFDSPQELHAFLDKLERRPLFPVEPDEMALDAVLATLDRCTARSSSRNSERFLQSDSGKGASP